MEHTWCSRCSRGRGVFTVVNVKSDGADPDVFFRTLPHALPAPAWAEGWHTGLKLDYVADLGVHADAWFT